MGPRVASLAANVEPTQGMQDDHAATRNAGLGPLLLGSWAVASHSLIRAGYVIGAHGNWGGDDRTIYQPYFIKR